MDHPAFMAAMQAYEGHQPGDSEAGRMVDLMIHVATERATEWFWKGLGDEGSDSWASNFSSHCEYSPC